MVDKIGRKMVQFVAFLGSAIFLAALFICTRSRSSTTLFLYASRMFISIADMCGYVYTPEVLMPHSILLSLSFYSGFSVLGVVTVLLLPIETKGRALQ
ncbi:hypothetical protein pdam_00010487, partial [Pocillopora damicornis]